MRKGQIIVALDGMTVGKALKIAGDLKGMVWGFKVNDLLFEDRNIIRKLKKFGKVFADAKLHDIPNTVGNSVARLSKAAADIITVHATGGVEMTQVAKKTAGKSKIFGVTVLTSHPGNVKREVLKLVAMAQTAHLDGIVCSVHELPYIRQKKLSKIVPGIRPTLYKTKDDQRRTATPAEALKAGADFLVIGRPITNAKDPTEAVSKVFK